MKLKEIPFSLFSQIKLSLLSSETIKKSDENFLPVIVSLTTIPSRIEKVHLTIRSILVQARKPKKIVLWLPEDLKGKIPVSLKKLRGEIFEIHFTHLTCSHKKLIHSLKLFPEDIIITCDDDIMYRQNWLETLYSSHLKYPDAVIAHRVRCIKYDAEGDLLSYKKWNCNGKVNKKALLPIGAEGVLYPPHTFSEVVFNEDLFLKLAPKADDLWFKATALANGKYAKKSITSPDIAIPVIGTQKISLKKENVDEDRNRTQWLALADYFQIDIK